MKPLVPILLFVSLTLSALGGPKEDFANNRSSQRSAASSFRQGKTQDALSQLSAQLRPQTGPNGSDITMAQSLADICLYFHNTGESSSALLVAEEAIAASEPLLVKKSLGASAADLYCNLGLVCELVLHDLGLAGNYYTSALTIQPQHKLAQGRLQAVQAKLKLKASRGRK